MDQQFREFIIKTNQQKLNLSDDVMVAKFYHVTSTKNVKNILKRGFKSGTWFVAKEEDTNQYKRQTVKPYLMVCYIRLDGIVPSGDYFVSQHKLIINNSSVWIPVN